MMAYVTFLVNLSILRLSLLDWYRREEDVEIIRTFKISAGPALLISIILSCLIYSAIAPALVDVYKNLVLVSFILTVVCLYPLLVWIRKKMYNYFYVASYIAYDILIWFMVPIFLHITFGMQYTELITITLLLGVIIGTLIATAMIKELRLREWILGGIPGITTAISISDFITRAIGPKFPIVVASGVSINIMHIVLFVSLVVQYIYYKRITER
ncbi:MAG: hypothetical protein QXJ52_02300 [Candidatus Korarchaeota archaeon]